MMGTSHTEVIYRHLPGDINGLYDHHTNTIIIDPRCDPATQRSTEEHERVHAERGDTCCEDDWFEAKQELTVERLAALRLISIPALIEGIRECQDDQHLAAWLGVDLDMLRTRLDLLSETEKDIIEEAVDRLERTA